MSGRFWIETLGCPKNQVDSDKLTGKLLADGMEPAISAGDADLVLVNTCAFIESARQESIDVTLAMADGRKAGARVVVTGCMAERYGDELAQALPEVDRVVGFGGSLDNDDHNHGDHGDDDHDHDDHDDHENDLRNSDDDSRRAKPAGGSSVPVSLGRTRPGPTVPAFDLLNLPRPKSAAPWAYVKIAEGCDRTCGFCAIPSFRGPQRSRDIAQILDEVDALDVQEVVLVAQDLASYGKDRPSELGAGSIVGLVEAVAKRVKRTRLLYLYPSDLSDALIDVICTQTNVPYFDLSLQHVSKPLLRRMRRWGDGDRFLRRIEDIRRREPSAAFRSNFIVGYPGETEEDHDQLLSFVREARLDWCGFFSYSPEEGTYAYDLPGRVSESLMRERLDELTELQDTITAQSRDALIGTNVDVLVDRPGIGRTVREAPEIDGEVHLPIELAVGQFHTVHVIGAEGPDLRAVSPAFADLN